ncbi:ras and Rab interactor 3 [Platysternon megacephalum]|uniref:Ras and Rab interactor 3 n=1 Tax=Platysternon megacephalum TaxID=55544 RepID=A0A4D9F970_9SAUR|nr:ras and Rab interactor 3 [Platysternon megacephalum]
MGALQLAQEGDRLLYWGAGVVTLLFTLLAAFMFRLLLDYLGKWKALKPIPGVSPCYPLLGNTMFLERKGEDFFSQIVNNLEEYRNLPLLKLWIGPLPFVILYHPDALEVIAEKAREIENHTQQKDDFDDNCEQSGPKRRRAFLDMLLSTTDDEGNKLSYMDIREEVDTFMFEEDLRYQKQQRYSWFLMCCTENRRFSQTQKNLGLSDSSLRILREGTHMHMCPSLLDPETVLVCGQRFAQMEEKAVLAIILRRFWVETNQEREGLGLVGELILRPNKGIWIQLKRRECVSEEESSQGF